MKLHLSILLSLLAFSVFAQKTVQTNGNQTVWGVKTWVDNATFSSDATVVSNLNVGENVAAYQYYGDGAPLAHSLIPTAPLLYTFPEQPSASTNDGPNTFAHGNDFAGEDATYTDLTNLWYYLTTNFTDVPCTITDLGQDESSTYEIWLYDFAPTNYDRTIMLVTGQHGVEIAGIYTTWRFIYNVLNDATNAPLQFARSRIRWLCVPCANPWGFSQSPRVSTNVNTVNLNRNYPYRWSEYSGPDNKGSAPLSEAEAQHVNYVMTNYNPDAVLDVHNNSDDASPFQAYLADPLMYPSFKAFTDVTNYLAAPGETADPFTITAPALVNWAASNHINAASLEMGINTTNIHGAGSNLISSNGITAYQNWAGNMILAYAQTPRNTTERLSAGQIAFRERLWDAFTLEYNGDAISPGNQLLLKTAPTTVSPTTNVIARFRQTGDVTFNHNLQLTNEQYGLGLSLYLTNISGYRGLVFDFGNGSMFLVQTNGDVGPNNDTAYWPNRVRAGALASEALIYFGSIPYTHLLNAGGSTFRFTDQAGITNKTLVYSNSITLGPDYHIGTVTNASETTGLLILPSSTAYIKFINAGLSNPPTSGAGTAWIFSGTNAGTTELFTRDGSGNITQISPHAADAPASLLGQTDEMPMVTKEYNLYTGTARWINYSRAARRLEQLEEAVQWLFTQVNTNGLGVQTRERIQKILDLTTDQMQIVYVVTNYVPTVSWTEVQNQIQADYATSYTNALDAYNQAVLDGDTNAVPPVYNPPAVQPVPAWLAERGVQ